MKTKLYALNGSSIAEDDGRAWSWREPCSSCGRSASSQTGDITAFLVSDQRPVVRTDSGAVLLSVKMANAARSAGFEFPFRSATLLDQEENVIGEWYQLCGAEVLRVHSVQREACGCVRQVRWNPLVVATPKTGSDIFSLDVSESNILVSERLLDFLRRRDTEVVGEPVDTV